MFSVCPIWCAGRDLLRSAFSAPIAHNTGLHFSPHGFRCLRYPAWAGQQFLWTVAFSARSSPD